MSIEWAEWKRRISGLKDLDDTMGPSFTLGKHAIKAIAKHGPEKVDWAEVHKKTIIESIGQHGQDADDVLEAIFKNSPGALTQDVMNRLNEIVNALAPELSQKYDEVTSKQDAEYNAQKAANGGQIKFMK